MKNLYFLTDYKNNKSWKKINCLTSNNKCFFIDIPFENNISFNKLINGTVEFLENLNDNQTNDLLHKFEKNYNKSFELPFYFDRQQLKNNNEETFKLEWNSDEHYSNVNMIINFKKSEEFKENFSFDDLSKKVIIAEKEVNKILIKALDKLKSDFDLENFKNKNKNIDINIVKESFIFSINKNELFEDLYKKYYHNIENKMFLHKPILFFNLIEILNENDEKFFNNLSLILFKNKIL